MTRGRKPGKGKFGGGRPKGSPNKKGKLPAVISFRCDAELYHALRVAAAAATLSVNVYAREALRAAHERGGTPWENNDLNDLSA